MWQWWTRRSIKLLKVWWLRFTGPGGRRIRESSGTTVKGEAIDKLNLRLGEVASGRFIGPDAERVTFEDLMGGLEQS